MPLAPATKLGQYEILTPLGAGSMGEVYRARDPRLNREVAIKVLPRLVSSEPDRLIRFETEAKAAAALNHPNILSVYQMGTHEGVPYIVTELLEGTTLTELVHRGPVPVRQAIQFGIQIAHGLAAAHEKGIVHRDLKPDNLFITKDGRVKILDFGLAKIVTSPPSEELGPTVTRLGLAVGTVGYMAPEQVRGRAVDHRADIFALGAILYEMVMGRRTFQRPTEADTISAVLNEDPPAISQISSDTPVALDRIIRRCLEKNPEQRFQNASDLAFALQALSDPGVSPTGFATPVRHESRHARWLQGSMAFAVVAVLAVAASFLLRTPQPRVSNYVQLTHDGQPKFLVGTEGGRLYVALGNARSSSFSLQGIAEMPISGGDPRKIDVASSSNMIPVDLSPDGSEILFVDGQGAPPTGPLRTFSILGGSSRRVGDFIAETAAWSRDGKLLAFTNLGQLFVAKANGAEPRKLLTVKGDIRKVSWSPDSRTLRFDSTETVGTLDQQSVWEVGIDGSDPHQLLPGWQNPPDQCCGRWTADGKYFVFQSHGQIWALPRNGGLFHSQTKPMVLTSSPLTLSSPFPSEDGKHLLVIGTNYRGELTRYDSQSRRFSPFLGGISAEYVAFSKDGQWIAYVSYRDGILWRSRIDGSERQQLTYPPMYPLLPRWSPDGKQILFFEFATRADRPARIYVVASDGGTPRLLLPEDHTQQLDPNWSPDGTKIMFGGESNDPSSSIRILDLRTGKISSVPASNGLFSPRWSPSGRYVAAFSADSKTILLFDFQTGEWNPLAAGSFGWLNWSHDEQFVYLLGNRGSNSVVRIRISDHAVEQVVDLKDFPSTGRFSAALALTPDDDPLLLHDTGTQDIYSLDWQSQ